MIRQLLRRFAEKTKEVTTLSTQKPNWITKVDETGLHVETQSSREKYSRGEKSRPYYYISFDFLMDAWEEFISVRNASKDDFIRTQGRSSFIMAFFHELPFVEKSEKDNKTSIRLKEFTTDQLPEASLEQTITLLKEILIEDLNPKNISNKYNEDSIKRLKLRARQGLKILGMLDENYGVMTEVIDKYKETKDESDFIATQIKQHPYLSLIYDLLVFIPDLDKSDKLSFLSDIGRLLVRNSMGQNQMVESVAEYRTRNILNWFKECGMVDEEWNIVAEEKLSPQLLKVMNEFLEARQGPFSSHPLGRLLRHEIPSTIKDFPFINENYEVTGSIGKGNWTTVPWIAIMNRQITVSTQRGYYIVYLFSDDMKRLYLTFAQGVTETAKDEMIRINEEIRTSIEMNPRVHKDNNLDLGETKKARDYTESVAAYISYHIESFPSEQQLIKDLEDMVKYYEEYISLKTYSPKERESVVIEDEPKLRTINEIINHIDAYITSKGFYYEKEEVQNLYLSLRTKPFVILSGISGTGKTMVVKWLAESVGATKDNGQFTLIPVRPDWNDGSDLLGYVDIKGDFIEGPLTNVIKKAQENSDKPYFVLLDEMNLARVEYYFSDVLSVMESRELVGNNLSTLPLIKEEVAGELIGFPPNVYIIGTVNMDETTHPFSKKVLDRANTIEFNDVNLENLAFLNNQSHVDPVHLHNHSFVSSYIHLKDVYRLHADVVEHATAELVKINNILKPLGAHVGYRVRDEISFYLAYNKQGNVMTENQAMDRCILQKILPRISGSDSRVERVLIGLYKLFTNKEVPLDLDNIEDELKLSKYPRSTNKVIEMLRRLNDDGFTSFWIS
ncbi:McrB family protein [Litchfieldia alkalitelluris]|uniref:McrB family protein n=1 Tax=Litchfieldia alkalitelluris TaxID=304268 RepID=UPI000997F97D|nr:DUF3578 domain-containing protein [Litchfieldia alkalitelluris]